MLKKAIVIFLVFLIVIVLGGQAETEWQDNDPVFFLDVWDLAENDPFEELSATYRRLGLFQDDNTWYIWVSGYLLSPLNEDGGGVLWGGISVESRNIPVGMQVYENYTSIGIDWVERYYYVSQEHSKYCNYQYGYLATRITFPISVEKEFYSLGDITKTLQGLSLTAKIGGLAEPAEKEVEITSSYIKKRDVTGLELRSYAIELERVSEDANAVLLIEDLNESTWLLTYYNQMPWDSKHEKSPEDANVELPVENLYKSAWMLTWYIETPWDPKYVAIVCKEEYRESLRPFRSYGYNYVGENSIEITYSSPDIITYNQFIEVLKKAEIKVLLSPEPFECTGPYHSVPMDFGLIENES